MKLPSQTALVGGVAVAGLLLWWFVQKGNAKAVGGAVGSAAVDLITGTVGGVVKETGTTVFGNANALVPQSPDNLAYGGINALGSAATGDQNFSLGSWLYNVTH